MRGRGFGAIAGASSCNTPTSKRCAYHSMAVNGEQVHMKKNNNNKEREKRGWKLNMKNNNKEKEK